MLPGPFVDELARLQDQLPAFSSDAVQEVIREELGHPLEQLFDDFEPTPIAAASVAQVHRARLRRRGAAVAVKVRRPDIRGKMALDRAILLFVGRSLERLIPTLRLVSLEEALRVFCDGFAEQLGLDREAENNRRFQADFADDPDIHFPRLYEEACSGGVLTMEFVEGIHERDLIRAGADIEGIVKAGMRAVCRMVFSNGFVHADLHPGNLRFALPRRVIMLDLGLVGKLTDRDRIIVAQLLFSLATGDGRAVAHLFYGESPQTNPPDYGANERDVMDFVESVRARGLANLQVTLELGRLFDILRRHRIQARSHMTMVNLALATAEGMGKRLAPELALTDAALPYLAEALGVPPRAGSQ